MYTYIFVYSNIDIYSNIYIYMYNYTYVHSVHTWCILTIKQVGIGLAKKNIYEGKISWSMMGIPKHGGSGGTAIQGDEWMMD